MMRRSPHHLRPPATLTLALVLALSGRAALQERGHGDADRDADQQAQGSNHDDDQKDKDKEQGAKHKDKDDDDDQGQQGTILPTGQFVTPLALPGATQQFLNPGLAAYPNFVAGEAVRSQLSPDGATLAILTAGQNSLYKPDGTVDLANSTQFVFLYDVAGAHKAKPVLKQVIQQVNAHVGLVFAPDGNTLYAAGGNDDAVYVYTKTPSGFAPASPIPLGHFPPGAPANTGIGLSVRPMPADSTSRQTD